MDILWIMGFFFIFIFLAFIVIAVFLPEWVGITGKKAHSVMDEQRDDGPPSKDSPDSH